MEASYLEVRTIGAPAPFSYLPTEINIYILQWLDLQALVKLRGVCQFFCQTIDLNNLLKIAANRPFVSRIVEVNKRDNSIFFVGQNFENSVFMLQKLTDRFLQTLFPEVVIEYSPRDLSLHGVDRHDETLLALIYNQVGLKKWNQAYSLLVSLRMPMNKILGYLIVLERGKVDVLEAYPDFIVEVFGLIESIDAKWHRAYFLLILSIFLSPFRHKFGLEVFYKAKEILLTQQNLLMIPDDRCDQSNFFCCIEKLGVASLFYDSEVFIGVAKELSNPDVTNTNQKNCAVNLANCLLTPNWIIKTLLDLQKERASTSIQEFIETCLHISRVIGQENRASLIKKMIFRCIHYKIPLHDELNNFIEQPEEYAFKISLLEKRKLQDPSISIDQQIETYLKSWFAHLQKFSWKRPPKTPGLEAKITELISFVRSSIKFNFQNESALELLKRVKEKLFNSTNFASL